MKVTSGRMKEYSDSGPKLLPRTPVVIELLPRAGRSSIFKDGKFLPEIMCSVCGALDGAMMGYTDYSGCSLLLTDYPGWDSFSFRDPQELSSLAAAAAVAATRSPDILFTARSFNLPKDEVANYFIWKQASLASRLLRLDGLPTDPDAVSGFLRSGPAISRDRWVGTWWRGRACVRLRFEADDGCDPAWFWDVDTNTPVFSSARSYINSKIYGS